MKMKYAIYAVLMIASGSIKCVKVQMPSAPVLNERLEGCTHFVQQTQIVKKVANKELTAEGVAIAIDFALSDYEQYLKKSMPSVVANTMIEVVNRSFLLETLLEDSEEGLKELQKLGLYTPKKK